MDTKKVLSGLCYFSIFFAPFLFPIVVYFVAEDSGTKSHAKSAFWSHLLPFAAIPIAMLAFFFSASAESAAGLAVAFLGFAAYGILSLAVVIWNLIKGIKVFQEN
ncbi:DUF4870 domain-containing protein [Neobacillus notoginsengisoli]|uniref:DUF4870 domain-containing protein n=1 Tax=Neobacillus notoginsengisoli TaxID=1578198 RepID=A0A417YSE5_9BACI|nr:DUF4870 domain-containing protein [Neobacillus notoginsengisoli]RHW38907.1 DUF4870 domain-containing protein [Neobacillus notoginsengisoli]